MSSITGIWGHSCSALWQNWELNYELLNQVEQRLWASFTHHHHGQPGYVYISMIHFILPSSTFTGRAVCKASLPLCVFCQGCEGNCSACCLFLKLSCAWTMTLVLPFSICQATSDILESLLLSVWLAVFRFSEFIVFVFDNRDFTGCVCDWR